MNRHFRNLILGAGAGLLLVALAMPALRAQPSPSLAIARNFTAPTPPATQPVYRLVPLFRTPDEVRARAQQAGLTPASLATMKTVGALNTVRDANWTFHLDTDRQMETLMDNAVIAGRYGRSLLVPSEASCRQAALHFLGRRKLVAGSDDEELVYERTNEMIRGYRGVADKGPAAPPVVVLREVVFTKALGGVRCTGQGTRFSVFVGDGGRVMGYLANWMPAVATTDRAAVATVDTTLGRLSTDIVARDNGIGETQSRAASAAVRGCRYVLTTQPDRNGGLVTVPAFEYRGQVTDRRRRSGEFSRVVPALREANSLDHLLLVPAADTLERVPAARRGR